MVAMWEKILSSWQPLALLFAVVGGIWMVTNDNAETRAAVASLADDFADMRVDMRNLQTDVNDMRVRLDVLGDKVDRIQVDVDQLKDEVDDLQSDVAEVRAFLYTHSHIGGHVHSAVHSVHSAVIADSDGGGESVDGDQADRGDQGDRGDRGDDINAKVQAN